MIHLITFIVVKSIKSETNRMLRVNTKVRKERVEGKIVWNNLKTVAFSKFPFELLSYMYVWLYIILYVLWLYVMVICMCMVSL